MGPGNSYSLCPGNSFSLGPGNSYSLALGTHILWALGTHILWAQKQNAQLRPSSNKCASIKLFFPYTTSRRNPQLWRQKTLFYKRKTHFFGLWELIFFGPWELIFFGPWELIFFGPWELMFFGPRSKTHSCVQAATGAPRFGAPLLRPARNNKNKKNLGRQARVVWSAMEGLVTPSAKLDSVMGHPLGIGSQTLIYLRGSFHHLLSASLKLSNESARPAIQIFSPSPLHITGGIHRRRQASKTNLFTISSPRHWTYPKTAPGQKHKPYHHLLSASTARPPPRDSSPPWLSNHNLEGRW